jgi:hypothetical protein
MRFLSAVVLTVAAVLAISVTSCETHGEPEPIPNLDAGQSQGPHHDAFQPPGDVFQSQFDGGGIGNPDAF